MARTSKDFDLGFGHFGNGLLVWNRFKYEHGDYENIAHIRSDRSVKFYKGDLPDEVVGRIYRVAVSSTVTISATQDEPVFSVPPLSENEDNMEQKIISQRDVKVTFSEPTPEDVKPFVDQGFNVGAIDFPNRVKVTVQVGGESCFTFIKREDMERLGEQYIVDHATLEKFFDGYHVSISQNDYYNDLSRNPEKVIPVRFVKTENGTGREIYRGMENDRYYAREVYFPRENCAKWFCYGKDANAGDGELPRPNIIFECDGEREKVTYDDWNDVMAYSETFNENFNKIYLD